MLSNLCSFLQMEIFVVEAFLVRNELSSIFFFILEMQAGLTLLRVSTEEEKKVQTVTMPKSHKTFHLFHMIYNLIWLKNYVCLLTRGY